MNFIAQSLRIGDGKLKVVVKDTIDIKGFRTVAGSKALLNSQPAMANAKVVDNIIASDCQILGKANLHELAFGITGINEYFGTPVNFKYPSLIPGGSSSGSAVAIATNSVDFSLGTDTGGSIRMPATCCGVYGLKPTYGRVSREGVHPINSSLDCVGPFAHSIEMIEKAMSIIEPNFSTEIEVKTHPKLAMLEVSATDTVLECIHQYLLEANIATSTISIKYFDEAYDAGMQIINYENWQAFETLVKSNLLGKDVENRLIKASKTSKDQLEKARKVQSLFSLEVDKLLEVYDALLLPTLPRIPPRLEEAHDMTSLLDLTSLVRPFNLSGHPAISIPMETKSGFPVGLQIVTKKHQDEQLCAIAKYIVKSSEKSTKRS